MISMMLNSFFYASPTIEFSDKEVEHYEDIVQEIKAGKTIIDNVPYSTYRLLQYISLTGDYLFHGSNNQNIDNFEPRDQTLFNGKLTNATFATSDPIWPLFYAVLNRENVISNFRNGCLVYKNKRYHFYSLTKSTMRANPWTEGMIYILPRGKYYRPGQGRVYPDEWICHEHVKPVGTIKVNISDFYFKDKVAMHNDNESVLKTWCFYKRRTLKT